MISRYDKSEISSIWTDHFKFQKFLEVEIALMEAQEKNGLIPKGSAQIVQAKVQINTKRIEEIEKDVGHDVIAFCSSITEQLPRKIGKYFHFGVTSSDIIDTALNLQIKASLDTILPAIERLLDSLQKQAIKHKKTLCLGRSHGMYAEPMSFGQKFLSFYIEIKRRLNELKQIQKDLTGQLSGAVGNYTILSPKIETHALKKLGLNVEKVSSQVIPRDHIAKLILTNANLAATIERIATEIRLLHHSDVGEINEGFGKNQKGSSTMPHKKNPISAENLCGLARVIKSHVMIALEDINLWHERDVSHSSAERIMLPDNLGLIFYAISRLGRTIDNLVIHQEIIEKKVENEFTFLSSLYLHHLLANTELTREEAYPIIQEASFKAQSPWELISLIEEKCPSIKLPKPDLESIRNIYLKDIEKVYNRALLEDD
ncbi:MAG: adenylosuccinate lyase [Bacteriovoracia bacterium]